jgi:alkanesulfonate monooxygenase SsuD/methylene tetrahydromethanopterin reductase-like flavin-dependent oxidoreductase (luciferase family)
VRALHTLFWDEVSSFDGELYTVPPSRMAPKPIGPALLLGGSAPAALRRAGRLADGWVSRSATDLTKIAGQIAVVREAAEQAGKDPAGVRIVVRGVVRAGDDESRRLAGSYEKIRADTAWLGEQGVTEVFYDLNWDPRIGNPAVAAEAATARAEEILTELRPAR